MQFVVDDKIWTCFPGLKIAVVILRGVDNQTARPEVGAELAAAWTDAGQAAQAYGNPQSHPRIKPWGDSFKRLGVSRKEFPSSIEALVRRAGKGGPPIRINPLVDFYNSVSLRQLVPAGGFDLDQLAGNLELRLTRPGDSFQALDDEAAEAVPAGEVAYVDGTRVLTRHLVWRQSRLGLIRPESRNVLLLSEVLGGLADGLAEKVRGALATGVADYFGITPELQLLDAGHSLLTIA